MFRGTSPSLRFAISAATAAELGNYYITFAQNGKELFTVDNTVCSMTQDGDTAYIELQLEQDKTLKLEAGLDVDIQIRALTKEGRATASPIVSRPVFEILHDGFIA